MKSNYEITAKGRSFSGVPRQLTAQYTIEISDLVLFAKARNGREIRLGPDGMQLTLMLLLEFPDHPRLNRRLLGSPVKRDASIDLFIVNLRATKGEQEAVLTRFVQCAAAFGSQITLGGLITLIDAARPGCLK